MNEVLNVSVKKSADGGKHLNIQIHGVIGGGWLDEATITASQLAEELKLHADAKTVFVDINSVGGSLFDGIAMLNALDAHPGNVTTRVTGLAASAASLPALAGRTEMGLGAMMMIHRPMAMAAGTSDEMRAAAKMLDQSQAALASIYAKKTGKPLDEINALINEETWMTAEEAVAAGFADAVVSGEHADVPAQPEARGDLVVWNAVEFPRSALPAEVLAKLPQPKSEPVDEPPPVVEDVAPVVLTREVLAAKAPELLAALLAEGQKAGLEEGKAAGVAEERARLKAIDEVAVAGHEQLVLEAKYGDKPIDAATLAVEIVKAQRQAGTARLAARVSESQPMAGVRPMAPEQIDNKEAAREEAAKQIAAGGNARRGGTPR